MPNATLFVLGAVAGLTFGALLTFLIATIWRRESGRTRGRAPSTADAEATAVKPGAGRGGPSRDETVNTLHAVLQASPLAIVRIDAQGYVTFWNRAAEAIFGWSAEEALGHTLPYVPQEKEEEFRALRRRAFSGEAFSGVEAQRVRKDGTPIDVSISVAPVRDAGGEIASIVAFVEDITARKAAEETLREQQTTLNSIFEAVPAGVGMIREREFVWVNEQFTALTGYTPGEVVGHSTRLLYESDEAFRAIGQKVYKEIEEGRAGSIENRIIRKDGRSFEALISFAPIDASDPTSGIIFTLLDITQLRQTEARLRQSEAQYRRLVETAFDLIWAIDAEGRITFMNQASRRIYGREPEEMIGRLYTDFVPAEQAEKNAQIWESAVAGDDRIVAFENWVLHKDGSKKLLSANAILMRDDEGNVVGSMGTSQDITARRASEQALQEYARRLETLKTLSQEILAIQSPQKTAQTAVRYLKQLLDADRISISLFSGDETEVQILAVYSRMETQLDQRAEHSLHVGAEALERLQRGHMYRVDDLDTLEQLSAIGQTLRAAGMRSVMSAPLISEGKLIAMLSVAALQPDAFSQRHETILREVANPVAIAIRQAQLLQEERRQRQLAQALQQAGRALSATLDVETIWDRVLEHIGSVVPYDSASVMAIEGDEVVMTRLRGYWEVGGEALEQRVSALRLPIAQTANLQEMLQTGHALVVSDTTTDPDWYTPPDITHVLSWAGAPIHVRGETLAFFSVDKNERNFYKAEHGRLLEAFAGTVSLALENARLYAAEREARLQLGNLAEYLQEAREEESARIAREIHDEFGQSLTALNMDVSWLAQRLPDDRPEMAKKVQEMGALIRDSVHMVRRIASELRPGLLDDLGLAPALEWQLQEFGRRSGLAVRADIEEVTGLDRGLATALFRICQEALTNVARHAEASAVAVTLKREGGDLLLTVRDDGRGISRAEVHDRASLGLTGMIERARAWGGDVQVRGKKGQGTVVTARMPLDAAAEEPG